MSELKVKFGGYSTAGLKPGNEDAFAALQPVAGLRRMKGAVAVIADGVSSSPGAQKASHTAVTQFIDDYLATPQSWATKLAAARVISALNRWLFQHGRESASLVTTFSALIVKSATAHVLHVGDGRVWRWRDGELHQLTRDHRAGGDTFLTRALGMDLDLDVDYVTDEVCVGDIYVLSTDGVHDWLSRDVLIDHLNAGTPCLERAAAAIVDRALALGSDDNATCLLVHIDELPLESIDEAHRRLSRQVIPPALDIGAVIDGYRVMRVLCEGPRSHLYLVQNLAHERDSKICVMKVPSENFADDPVYLEGFLREDWIGRRLDHPGIVKYFERPHDSAFLYALLEYVPGRTLRQWIHDHPKPPLQEVRRLVDEMARALRAMQRMQMVHRDLKPENVMIDTDGRIRIIDLGTVHVAGFDELASAVRETVPVGSVGYVAPECLAGAPAGHAADIFSLGVVTYEMLTGKLPYRTPANALDPSSYRGLTYQNASQVRPDIPPWLEQALRKAVAARPAERYAALSEFLTDLNNPNPGVLKLLESAPLMEKHPVMFWKVTSLILLVLLVLSIALRH